MIKFRVLVTGASRDIQSKGKTHTFSEVWVSFPGLPYPTQVDHYGIIDLAPGEYEVPVLFRVRDGRINTGFNFKSAQLVKGA